MTLFSDLFTNGNGCFWDITAMRTLFTLSFLDNAHACKTRSGGTCQGSKVTKQWAMDAKTVSYCSDLLKSPEGPG